MTMSQERHVRVGYQNFTSMLRMYSSFRHKSKLKFHSGLFLLNRLILRFASTENMQSCTSLIAMKWFVIILNSQTSKQYETLTIFFIFELSTVLCIQTSLQENYSHSFKMHYAFLKNSPFVTVAEMHKTYIVKCVGVVFFFACCTLCKVCTICKKL